MDLYLDDKEMKAFSNIVWCLSKDGRVIHEAITCHENLFQLVYVELGKQPRLTPLQHRLYDKLSLTIK
jgi:hypothetical protein